MKIKFNTLWIVFIVAAIVISVFFIGKCSNKDDSGINEQNLTALTADIVKYKTKYNQEVSSKQSFITENKKFKFLNDSLRSIIKNFKAPKAIIKIKEVLRIDTLHVPYDVPISISFERPFSIGDRWFRINGIASNTGLTLDNISTYNEQNIVFGEKKRDVYTVDITNSNPYLEVAGVQSYTYQRKKKWYEKWYITIPAGVVAGMAISK